MWKNCFKLFIILLCVITVDSVQAKAYTVTVKEDSIYSEVIPESFVQNAPAIFKDRKSTRLNSSHGEQSRMPSSA